MLECAAGNCSVLFGRVMLVGVKGQGVELMSNMEPWVRVSPQHEQREREKGGPKTDWSWGTRRGKTETGSLFSFLQLVYREESSSICQFTPQMTIKARAGLGFIRVSHRGAKVPKHLDYTLLLSQVH